MKIISHPLQGFIVKVVLLLVGGGLLFGAYSMWSGQTNFIHSSIASKGTVIELIVRKTKATSSKPSTIIYVPVVEYSENDTKKTFVSQLAGNPPPHNVGENVDILIPKNGGIPQINSFGDLWMGVIIMGGIGAVITLILLLNIYSSIVGKKYQRRLEEEGIQIHANTVTVEESTYSKNQTLTWRISAQWLNPQDNKVYVFYSEDIDYDPKDFIKDTINVTILPNDPRIYAMDISILPEGVNETVS